MKPNELENLVNETEEKKDKEKSQFNWENDFIIQLFMEKRKLSFRQIYNKVVKEAKKRCIEKKIKKVDSNLIEFWDNLVKKNLALTFLNKYMDASLNKEGKRSRIIKYFLRMNGMKFPFKGMNDVFTNVYCDQIASNLDYYINNGAVEYKDGFYYTKKTICDYYKFLNELQEIPDEKNKAMDYAN